MAILTPRPDEFLVVSFPVEDDRPDCPTKPLDKHHVRGRFVSVEQVRKVENDEVEWRCASMSFAAGSIPIRLSESHMFVNG